MLTLKKPDKPVDDMPVGNRRAQLVAARAKPKPQASGGLTKEDVVALKNDKSPAVRGQIAKKFGGQFDHLARSPHRDLASAVLNMLVKDVSVEVRTNLAREISSSENLPAKAVSALARDDINVAMPILRNSPLLQDEELMEIVRTQSMQYALAIAGREHVSEALTDTLIDTGHRDVVLTVTGNAGAEISQQAMQRVIDEHSDDIEIQDRMVRRPALPFDITEQLIGIISDKIEWELTETRKMPLAEADRIMKAVRDSVGVSLTAKDSDQPRQMQAIRRMVQAGEFERIDAVKALRDGDIQLFEIAMAVFAKIDLKTVRKLLYSDDRRRMAALCAAGEFSPPHYLTIRMALELAHEASNNRKPNQEYGEDSVRYVLNQYEKMRLDSDKVQELIDI